MSFFTTITSRFNRNILGRFHRDVWIITIIQTFTSFGFSICLPFLALYLHQERGIPMTLVGMMFLVAGVCSTVTHIIGGMLADKFGRRRLILGITMISILLYSGLAVLIGSMTRGGVRWRID